MCSIYLVLGEEVMTRLLYICEEYTIPLAPTTSDRATSSRTRVSGSAHLRTFPPDLSLFFINTLLTYFNS